MPEATGKREITHSLKMEAILEALAEGISVQDRNFRILYQNPAHVKLHGVHVGDYCFKAYVNASEVCEGCPVAMAFEDGTAHTVATFKPDEAGTLHVEITASPLTDASGEVFACIEIVRDITDKKDAEDELRRHRQELEELVAEKTRSLEEIIEEQRNTAAELQEALARFGDEKAKSESIIAAIGEGISIRDLDYRILYQNQIMIDAAGDHTGELCYQALHARDQVCEGCPVALSFQDGKTHTAERQGTTRKGLQYFESTASPIRDAAGKITGAVELIRNITEKKRAELALQEANARLEALLNAIPDMVIFKDARGRYLVVNRAVEAATGLPREEILGKLDEEISPLEVAAMCRASDEKAMNADGPVHSEESVTGSDGEPIFLDTIKAPMRDEQGNLAGVVVVSRDITERKKGEEALRLSEQRLSKAQQMAHVGNWAWDIVKNELYWSDEVYRIYGREPGLFTPTFEAVQEAMHPDDLDPFLQAVQAAIQERLPFGMDYRLLRPDGAERTVHTIGEVTYDAAGHPLCKSGTIQDITGRKRLEAMAREQYAILESIVESTRNPIFSIDCCYCYTSFNKGHAAVMKDLYDAEIGLGKSILEFIPEADRYQAKRGFDQALDGRSLTAEAHYGKGKQARLYESAYNPIRAADGRVVGVAVYARDTTERRRAEEQIKSSEKRLRDITANLGVGVYVLDGQARINFMNPMAEQLWGWTLEELQEKGVHELVHCCRPDGAPLPLEECQIMGVIRKGQPYTSTEDVFMRKDGTIFPISITATPLLEGGRVVASVTAFRDITAEKKLEAELLKTQKLESVGILAGGIAHDFNNLLQAILGGISLAKMDLENDELERIPFLLQQAEEASEAARELSFRLLTFSKGGEPVKTLASIEEIIRKSISLSLSGSSVTCDLKLPSDLPPVEVDGGQMMQVFNNILINAREAMPQGGTIGIRAKKVEIPSESPLPLAGGEYLCISIRDSGCGIPAENLSRIFDPYFSMKGMGSRKGSGLGLSICMAVVRKHGGHISVESQPGQGAAFHIYIPSSPKPVSGRKTKGKTQPALAGKRVLFMDDDERVRQLVGKMMASLGCEIECARHGEEAVGLYREAFEQGKPFAGVVLDLTVKGGFGGDKAITMLQGIDPRVKAVIASGYADNPIMKQFKEYGFMDALPKPFTIRQLNEVLAKF